MTKTATLAYGPQDIPVGVERRDLVVQLIANDGSVTSEQHADYDVPTVDVAVGTGTGWVIRVQNFNTLDQVISQADSPPFDVDEGTHTVQVVTAVAV